MTKFILVRHGKPYYDDVLKYGFKGHGIAFAPLSMEGIKEIKMLADDSIFSDCDLLLSSPYTRAMQTASIISMKTHLPINVELLLHEWIPDLTNNYNTIEEFTMNLHLAKYEYKKGMDNPDFKYSDNIESLVHVKERALSVLEKYLDYNKVIVVTHGLLINTLLSDAKLHTGEYAVVGSKDLFMEKCLVKQKR